MPSNLFDTLTTWQDVEGLLTSQIRESEVVEYKEANNVFSDKGNFRQELAKDVSAFANSDGGVLVFGVKTHATDKTLPEAITGIIDSNIESFDRLVNANIRKDIKGITKRVISKGDGSLKVMVVNIPQSEDAPHQSLIDKKYYIRRLAQSEPMEHYLVELMFGRRFGPVLDLNVELVGKPEDWKLEFKEDGFANPLTVRLTIVNTGKRVGRYTQAILLFPPSSEVRITGDSALTNIDDLYTAPGLQARQFAENIGVFHPGMSTKIADIKVEVAKGWAEQKMKDHPLVQWTLFADNMNPRTGMKLLATSK